MNLSGLGTEGVLVLALIMLVKDLLIPMWKRLNGKGNPINLDRLYQAFKDFKFTQEKWNDNTNNELKRLDNRIDKTMNRRK